jgi:ATP-dependent helicase/nuclease subunit A
MSPPVKLTEAQQAAAVSRAGENVALRSGAGCGKTLVLARRFTELLMQNPQARRPLERFVALTFTDKAAVEMQQRVRRMLSDFAAGSKGADRRRLLEWVDELAGAQISTIHAFCARLLRAHAIEAGLDPAFAVCADTLVAERLAADAADRAALAAVEQQRGDVLDLLARMSFERLVGLLRQLLGERTVWTQEAYADPAATLQRWRELTAQAREGAFRRLAADAELAAELEAVAELPCDDPADRLLPIRDAMVETMREMLADLEAWTAERFAELAAAAPGNYGGRRAWGAAGGPKPVRHRLKDLRERFVACAPLAEGPGERDAEAAAALAALTRLAAEADRLYAAAKRAAGMLDFTDLLVEAHRLLASDASLRRRLAGQMDQLLMDECQDTNGFQVSLLEMLVSPDAPEANPPAGRLFLVGDKKQSIYRFRGAQVEVFEALCERLGRRGQERLELSFRTHAAGVAFINELFQPLMGDDYEPITAHRSELPDAPAVEIILARGEDGAVESAEESVGAQAAATAERIHAMLDAGERIVWDAAAGEWRAVRPGDVAILFARMTHSLAYERELTQRGVDYYVVAGTGFFRRQEVYDLLNALRVIDNPFDDVAFAGVLRSALVGLDDNALMHVAAGVERPLLPSLLREGAAVAGLAAADAETLAEAAALLGSLHASKDALGPAGVLERLLWARGYEAALLARFNGRRMVGNVRRLLELARSAAAEGAAVSEFIAEMDEQVLEESRYEQAAVAGEAEDVVRLMTIHKAKGLEFPVVFVPDLNAGRRGGEEALLSRLDWGLTLNLPAAAPPAGEVGRPEGGEEAPASVAYRIARQLEDEDERREDVRKLYVAATRHRDHLVFVAADWRSNDGKFREGSNYIAAMDAVLDIAAAADDGRDILYGDGRFTAAVRTPSAAAGRGGRRAAAGSRLLREAASAADLASRLASRAAKNPAPGVGPIPPQFGVAELAVTALSEFAHCPMLYRWRYELRVPDVDPAAATGAAGAGPLDAATAGTLFHRCMELLDFDRPQGAAALVRRAAGEMSLGEAADIDALAADLDAMLAGLNGHALWGELVAARQTLRELDFILRLPPATLRGKIDLLYQAADGEWRIVDYKSDRVGEEGAAEHAGRYELQMLAYAAAAARHLGRPPAAAMLYFLPPAVTCDVDVSPEALEAAVGRIAALGSELIAARREGRFERREGPRCAVCPYRSLCERA